MKMLRFVLPSLLATLAVGCGTSPLQACKDRGAAECKKMWTCTDAVVKLGKDQADCVSTYDNLCTLSSGGCLNGKSIDTGKLVACTADVEAATCDAYKTLNSANCAAVKCD